MYMAGPLMLKLGGWPLGLTTETYAMPPGYRWGVCVGGCFSAWSGAGWLSGWVAGSMLWRTELKQGPCTRFALAV